MNKAPASLRNRVTYWIWAIVLIPTTAFAVALSVYVVRLGLFAELQMPSLPSVGPQFQGVIILGLLLSPVVIGWILVRYTFGPRFTDDAVESGTEAVDSAQDTLENLSDD